MKSRYGATNVKSAAIETNTAAPGSHHQSPSSPREAHHDEQGDADGEELRAEDRPVLEQPVEVAELALLVATRPPVRHEPERQVDEPDDAEPEHAEEHPRADRPRRGLADEGNAASRVQPEREQERDLREHPEHVEHTLVALRLCDEAGSEDGVDVDRRAREVVRHRGGVEEERSDCERREHERGEGGSQKAPPRSGAVPGGTCSTSTGTGARRIGVPYG